MKQKTLYLRHCLAVLPAVPICALGVVIFLKANLGADPLTMFEIALSKQLHISLGRTSLFLEGSIFIIFFFLNRKLINFGSFAYAFGLGPCIDFFTPIVDRLFPINETFMTKINCLLLGMLLICFALAYYIPMNFGYQTSDILTLSIKEWLNFSYGVSLTIVYTFLFVAGFLLNGPWGIGTLMALFLFGPLIELIMHYTHKFSLKIYKVPN